MSRAEIGHTPAVYALKRLHAELGGKIKDNRREAKGLAENMKHVEAVLKMLEPGFDVRAISARRRYKAASPYKRGDVFRAVIDLLRTSVQPLTARVISETLLRKAGQDHPSVAAIRSMLGAVNKSLRNHEGKTIARVGEGMPARWKIVS